MTSRKRFLKITTDVNRQVGNETGSSRPSIEKSANEIAQITDGYREILSPKDLNRFPRTPRTPSRDHSLSPSRDRSLSPGRDRSLSPTSNDDRYLPNSHARSAKEGAKKIIRESPSFRPFHQRNRPDFVTIPFEEYKALEKRNGRNMEEEMSRFYGTGWDILQAPVPHQIELPGLSSTCSDYDNTYIEVNDLRPWKGFPTFEDIERFIKNNPALNQSICKVKLTSAARKHWYLEELGIDGTIPATDENSITRNHQSFFSELSALLCLACKGPRKDKYARGLRDDGIWINVGGGKCGMKRRERGLPGFKVPDLVSYWTSGKDLHLAAKKGKPHPALEQDCLIVGDFKPSTKFKHSMLKKPPAGQDYPKEAQKVLFQIHDYMDMHHNRFGYVIGNNELIMFRRRDTPPGAWGQLDFSDPIPLNTEKGKLNGMMVLFYFHVKYVVLGEDGGWNLPSAYEKCPARLLGKSARSRGPKTSSVGRKR